MFVQKQNYKKKEAILYWLGFFQFFLPDNSDFQYKFWMLMDIQY